MVVSSAASGGGVRGFSSLLKALKNGIKEWRITMKDKEEEVVRGWVEAVEYLEQEAEVRNLSNQERELRANMRVQIKKFHVNMARDLQQKARERWIRDGDENSSYFHAVCNINKGRSRLNGLHIGGVWVKESDVLKEAIKNHFKKLFAEPIRRRPSFQNLGLNFLNDVQAASLVQSFSESEVRDAIWSCDGSKAPGPDGFTTRFLRKFWAKLKPFVMSLMEDFYTRAEINAGSNPSFIVLLPKVEDPTELGDFRPISLIGLLYKIIAKVLANRLKPIFGKLISHTQSAFVGSRNILDGPLIVSEVVSWAKKYKTKVLIFKVDFAKAYDTLNWKFLIRVLGYMKFPAKWIKWVSSCLKSGKGSVILNGSPTGEFVYKRGLRQGDPLSPSLFIIALEVLDMIMKRAEALGLISGIKLPNGGPVLTHLSYADDVMFLCEWSVKNAENINRLLRCFSLLTGLNVNLQKSKVFGVGTSDVEIEEVAGILKCGIGEFPFLYLGLPIGANMKRKKHWEPVIKRFQKRLNGWKAKTLSFAGRVTLAKSVLGSLSSYFLGIFKAPKVVLNKLEGIRRSFVWGQVGNRNKISWIRWVKLLRPKQQGGLGLGGLESFNLAMLAKWWWRFRDAPNQLWARAIAAIHGPDKGAKRVPVNKTIIGWWKDIANVDGSLGKKGISIKDALKVELGNGEKIRFWHDDWVGHGPLKFQFPNVFKLVADKNALVSSCYEFPGTNCLWSWGWAKDPASAGEWAELGHMMRLLQQVEMSGHGDKWVWPNDAGESFSTRCIRKEIEVKSSVFSDGGKFKWNSWAPPKVNYLGWRAELGRLAAKVKLAEKGLYMPDVFCSRCGLREETSDHIFTDCLWAKCVWWNVYRWIRIPVLCQAVTVGDILNHIMAQVGSKRWKKAVHMVALGCLWRIWLARNDKEFNGKMVPVKRIVESIKEETFMWFNNRARGVSLNWNHWIDFDISMVV
ncbi:putative RNA-directed DNA polymerase [Helianthus annuus]|nr:putative RNA-directed DNA polymerase [Helianthus annuus]